MITSPPNAPLAERVRPKTLEEVVGQEHLLAEGSSLAAMLRGGISSFILWGPPGSGKTTIASLAAARFTDAVFSSYSAVLCGLTEMRKVFAEAQRRLPRRAILFLDEIHRFNRSQQDAFLPHLESGLITLIGATTQNPSFELNGALLSRCRVFVLKPLDDAALATLLDRFLAAENLRNKFADDGKELLVALAEGDARRLFNNLEAVLAAEQDRIDAESLQKLLERAPPRHDKAADGHYNLASALHKSLRASDTDAALYWTARMLTAGEDPQYLSRRLVRFASEDIGLADPQALATAIDAWQAWNRLGPPEGETAIAQAVVYLATAPKSNAVYKAWNEATAAAERSASLPPPMHILNAPTKLMKKQGFGANYRYDHDYRGGFAGQNCFPAALPRRKFYNPNERGFEREIVRRLNWWEKHRKDG